MGTVSCIATLLDAEMIGLKKIFPPGTPFQHIEVQQGPLGIADLAEQVGGRHLLHYVRRDQVGRFHGGRHEYTFVTPTSYSPEETVSWLALPLPAQPREFVLLLDPTAFGPRAVGPLWRVYGPRWVLLGGGIEYILADGFPPNALVDVAGAGPVSGRWELEVR